MARHAQVAPLVRGRGRPPRNESGFLEAAQAVFAEFGFEGASMDQLAAAANTTRPTLYSRFGSKEALYERIVRDAADVFATSILRSYDVPSELSVHDTVNRTVTAWFGYLSTEPHVLTLLFAPDRSPTAQRIAEEVEDRIISGLSDSIERTLARSGRSGGVRARFVASMVFGAVLYGARENARGSGLSTEQATSLASSFLYAAYVHLDPLVLDDANH